MTLQKFNMGLELFSSSEGDVSWVVDANGREIHRGTYASCREYLRAFGARIIN